MNFTDDSYYKGDIDIPFENKNTSVFTRDYITPLEQKIQVQCFGRKLYNEFQAGIALPSPDQKWLDLRDGAEFNIEYEGVTYPIKWNGLKNTEKKSLLSYFIYTGWLGSNFESLLGTGVAAPENKNAQSVDMRGKYLSAQYKAGELIGSYDCDKDQRIILPDDMDTDLFDVFDPSLLNFLYHKRADYESWIFTPFELDNYFDL